MVQPDRQDRQPAARRETPPSRPAGRKALSAARNWFEGSLAQSFVRQLKELDFASQAALFGAGLLVSVLPFVILLSAFASQRVDDDISLRMGLNRRAAGIVDHLFTSAPASLNPATVTSLVFVTAGLLAVASSLQQIYEKVFRQAHRGLRDLFRLRLGRRVVSCGGPRQRGREAGEQRRWRLAGPARHRRYHDAVRLVDDALPAGGPGAVAQAAAVGDHYRSLSLAVSAFSRSSISRKRSSLTARRTERSVRSSAS
jgi:hypothetical protein